MAKKIGITGFSGFVGKNLLPFLELNKFEIQPINLRIPNDNNCISHDVNVVIHLAGKAHDHAGVAKDEEYFEVNTELTKKIFDQFLQSNANVFIHFSTVAVIADETIMGELLEDSVPMPANAYGKSKLAAEKYLLNVLLPEDKKLFIIRPAMIHGPGDKGNLQLLYKFVAKGIPVPLASFKNKRSFLSIENLCFAIGGLINKSQSIPSGIYNLVDDDAVSTNEIVELISQTLGKKNKSLAIPQAFIKAIAKIGDFLPFPLNSKKLAKLTQDYIVSNNKIKQALNIPVFPTKAKEGLIKTIKSFAK